MKIPSPQEAGGDNSFRLSGRREGASPVPQCVSDGSDATGSLFVEGDRVASRAVCEAGEHHRGEPRTRPCAQPGHHAPTGSGGPAARKSGGKSSFPARERRRSSSRAGLDACVPPFTPKFALCHTYDVTPVSQWHYTTDRTHDITTARSCKLQATLFERPKLGADLSNSDQW